MEVVIQELRMRYEYLVRRQVLLYLQELFLTGYNSDNYKNNQNYFFSDLLIATEKDFLFPAISKEQYEYKGANTDFSYVIADLDFNEPDQEFVYEVNDE